MRKEIWRRRGRSYSRLPCKDGSTLEYLARIAVKHKIDSSEFFNCIVEAWNQEESKCKKLIIRCRRKTANSAIFLFTAGGKIVAQFPIQTKILQGKNQLEDYMKMISARAPSAKNSKVGACKIRDLKAGMKQVNLKARVLEIPKPKTVYTKWGTEAYISNALLADETGKIRMSLWNRQIDMVSEGDVVKIENGKVASFKGERQLRLGRNGKVTVVQDQNVHG